MEDFIGTGTIILQFNLDALIEKGQLPDTMLQRFIAVDRFRKDRVIRPEMDACSRILGITFPFYIKRTNGLTLTELNAINLAVFFDLDFHASAQSVDTGNTNSMKTAGDLITAIAKFTASVQDGHNNFNGRFADLMHFNRNPAPIIDDGDAVIFSDFNKDMVTVTGQGLIDRVIDDFINQMMEPTGTDTADIHAWPFANGFEALQDLDLLCPIFTVDGDFLFYRFLIVFFSHGNLPNCVSVNDS